MNVRRGYLWSNPIKPKKKSYEQLTKEKFKKAKDKIKKDLRSNSRVRLR